MSISIEQKEKALIRKFDKLLESISEFDNECLFIFEDIDEIRKGDIADPEFVAIQRCFLFASDINKSLVEFMAKAHSIEFENDNKENEE